MSLAGYHTMSERQGGVWAIRGGTNEYNGKSYLAVDHCHATGRVRGLLCQRCNSAIGLLDEDADRMRIAVEYVRRGGPA